MPTTETLDGSTEADWLRMIRDRGGQLRLTGRGKVFDVALIVCDNPDCNCEDVTLCFREAEPEGWLAAMAFDISLDLLAERDAEWKGLGEEAESAAKAVAAGFRGAGRVALRSALRRHRARLRRIPQTIAGYVARAEMVPFAHVSAGGDETDETYAGHMDWVEWDEVMWDVSDSICAAPRCDCTEVRLTFYGTSEGPPCSFAARVPTEEGPPKFEGLTEITLAGAQEVFAAWEAGTGFTREALLARYERVRALARAGAASAPATPRALASAPVRSVVVAPKGRREPCPCGSGKRYKNCCGRDDR